jgi:glycosyltransferase involved in cell wall biosynthesis
MFQISIIIPAFNAEETIERAIFSVLEQQETWEVIVVDDGSTDNTFHIITKLCSTEPKLVPLQHPDKKNHGISASRNLGIQMAKYPIIAFLDADDFYLENRFANAKILFNNPDVDGTYEAVDISDGHITQGLYTLKKKLTPEELFENLSPIGYQGWFHINGLTIKKKQLLQAGFFNEELRIHEDTEIFLKLSLTGNLHAANLEIPVATHIKNEFGITQNRKMFFSEQEKMFLSVIKYIHKGKLPDIKMHQTVYAYLNHFFFHVSVFENKGNRTAFRLKRIIHLLVSYRNLILWKTSIKFLPRVI